MFGIPTFDLLTDAGKQQFIEYIVNLTRKEIISYTPNYTQAGADISGYVKQVDFDNHVAQTINVHGIVDTSDLLTTADLTGVVYQNTPYLDFDTVTPGASGLGQIAWNDTEGTLEFGLKGGNVTLPIGQEQVHLVKHADSTGLTKGSAVYVVGSDGTNHTVRYAQANAESTSSKTFGIMAEAATGGSKGFCATHGVVTNINTASLTEGYAVWLSPSVAGGLTTTKPTAPNHLVLMGWCIKQHAVNGAVFVHVVNGFELDELHDVNITSVQPDDLLQYDSTIPSWKNVATIAPSKITGTAVITTDSRLSNARTPTTHASTHASAGSDPITISPSQVTGTAVITSDARLSDARTPTGAAGGVLAGTYPNPSFATTPVPSGSITAFAGVTLPSGWLWCNGTTVTSASYSDLYNALTNNGTTFPYGGSAGTTYTPDFRGRVGVGLDTLGGASDAARLDWANNVGTTGGAQYHTLSTSEIPAHSHTFNTNAANATHAHSGNTGYVSSDHAHNAFARTNGYGGDFNGTGVGPHNGSFRNNVGTSGIFSNHVHAFSTNNDNANHSHSGTTDNTGGSGGHNTMQPSILVNYIIKT